MNNHQNMKESPEQGRLSFAAGAGERWKTWKDQQDCCIGVNGLVLCGDIVRWKIEEIFLCVVILATVDSLRRRISL